MTIRAFPHQHDEMVAIAEAILTTVKARIETSSSDADSQLPALRMALSRQVATHCAAEVELLQEHLKLNPKVAVDSAPLIRRFFDELLSWRCSLMECNASWPAKRIAQEPQGFVEVFTPLVEALRARVAWEESEFYPRVLGRTITRRPAASAIRPPLLSGCGSRGTVAA
ncbi:hypothetical protein [Blastomonas sp.]|uniref:hypothetical protein n=1 Tax=Blastomonas sp. TaxID=1909299 RepID=UPI0035942ECC